jgi:hypothetical protein
MCRCAIWRGFVGNVWDVGVEGCALGHALVVSFILLMQAGFGQFSGGIGRAADWVCMLPGNEGWKKQVCRWSRHGGTV